MSKGEERGKRSGGRRERVVEGEGEGESMSSNIINQQQIQRCHEMYYLLNMDGSNAEVKKAYRLTIKSRLNKVSIIRQ